MAIPALSPVQVTGDIVKMARTNPAHMDASGKIPAVSGVGAKSSFDQAMLAAIRGDAATAGTSMVSSASTLSAASLSGVSANQADFTTEALRSLDEVSGYQQESSALNQQMIVDPDSVDAHDVTIAMAKANLSLNLARAVVSRVTQAYRDIINSR